MKNILLILLLLLAFTACGDKSSLTDVLNRAETMMDEHPDSSLTLLRTLTLDDFQQEANRARYALLHSQALDKNYIDVTSDSIISVAVDYYQDEEDVRNKFLSYYYMGRVHANGGNSLKAMLSFSKAEQLEGEIRDSLALGLLYSQLGDLYREYYDFPKSLNAYQKAEMCYGQVSKEEHRLYAMLDQAYVFRDMENVDESFRLLQIVRENAERMDNGGLIRSALGNMFMLCIEGDSVKEAMMLFEELKLRYGLEHKTAAFNSCLSRFFASKRDESEAFHALEQGWELARTPYDSVILYSDAAKVYERLKQPEQAYQHIVAATMLQNRLVRKSLQQPVLTVRNDYLSGELENQAEKLRLEKRLRIVSIMFVIVVAGVVVYFLQRIIRKRFQKRLEQRDAEYSVRLDRLKHVISEKEHRVQEQMEKLNKEMTLHESSRQKIEELKREIGQKDDVFHRYMEEVECMQKRHREKERNLAGLSVKLLVNRTKLINVLLDGDNSDAIDKEKVAYQKLTALSMQLKKECGREKKYYRDLEQTVNECYDDAMHRIRSEVRLSDEESYQQVCYHLAGFSVKTIALLMGDTTNKIYKRRERIRAKMESSSDEVKKCLLYI